MYSLWWLVVFCSLVMAQMNISQSTSNYTTISNPKTNLTRMPRESCRIERAAQRIAKRLDRNRINSKKAAFARLYVAQIAFGSVLGAISIGVIVHAMIVLCKTDKNIEQQQEEMKREQTRLEKMTTQVVEELRTGE